MESKTVRNNIPPCIGINGDIAGTLDANYYKGCGERQGIEREVVFVKRAKKNDRTDKLV